MQRIAWVLAVLAALTVPAAIAAQIYKWSDAQGQVHYGELPPVGRPAQKLDVNTTSGHSQPPASTPAAKPAPTPSKPGNPANTGQGKTGTAAQSNSLDPQQLQQQCRNARQNLQVLKHGPSNRRFREPSGKVVRYTQEQLQAKIAENEQFLKRNCQNQ